MSADYHQHLAEGERVGGGYKLVLPQRLPSGAAGSQTGKGIGSSLEFMDHRDYQPGDDLRRVDWNAYARTDKLTLKLYRDETVPHLDILLDASRSMSLPGSLKAEASVGLAAVFAAAARNGSQSHCLWLARDGCTRAANGNLAPTTWMDLGLEHGENPHKALAINPPSWRSGGMRLIISDLLWLGDPLQFLGHVAEGASAVYLVQVLSAQDIDPPELGNARLIDHETGLALDLLLDAGAKRRYSRRLARHQENWNRAARQVGAMMATIVAEELLPEWRLEDLVKRSMLVVE